MNREICCPKFEPEPWDAKTVHWEGKRFIKEKVFTLFYIPINFGRVMRRLDRKLKEVGLSVVDNLCLSDHTSKWNMDLYVAVDKEVPDRENVTLSGDFFSKVYEGPYKDTSKWCADFETLVKGMGSKIDKWFMWYTTCPKCAKKYGKNYVVIVGRVGECETYPHI